MQNKLKIVASETCKYRDISGSKYKNIAYKTLF